MISIPRNIKENSFVNDRKQYLNKLLKATPNVRKGRWWRVMLPPVPSTRCISTNRQRGWDAAGCHCLSECCITAFMAASLTFLAISHCRRQVRHVAIEQYSTQSIVHIDPACRDTRFVLFRERLQGANLEVEASHTEHFFLDFYIVHLVKNRQTNKETHCIWNGCLQDIYR